MISGSLVMGSVNLEWCIELANKTFFCFLGTYDTNEISVVKPYKFESVGNFVRQQTNYQLQFSDYYRKLILIDVLQIGLV